MIEVFFDGKKKVNARINGFVVKTDQGVNAGGEATAPEPFALFLASLATCAGIYVKSFCDNRGIPADDISLTMDYKTDPETRLVNFISIGIKLPYSFPEKYVDAVINAADLCKVKRHLSEKIRTEITIVR